MAELRIYFADCAGTPSNCSYPHEAIITDAATLRQAVSHDYVCVAYRNGHRANSNFVTTNCLGIIDLIHSVKSVYRKKAVFLLNDSTVKALRKLKDGSGQYLWQPGLKEGQPDQLLSYRLVTSAYMPEVASGAKPVLFGDFSSDPAPEPVRLAVLLMAGFFYENRDIPDMTAYKAMRMAFDSLLYPYRDPEKMF